MIDHISFDVADFDASKAFYSAALAPLGIQILIEGPAAAGDAEGSDIQAKDTQASDIQAKDIQSSDIQASDTQDTTPYAGMGYADLRQPDRGGAQAALTLGDAREAHITNTQIPNTEKPNTGISNTEKPNTEIPNAGRPFFWFGQGDGPFSCLHIAFTAHSRCQVDAFYKAALAAGGRDNGAPGLRYHYHAHYYGAFILDKDGHNLEAVCHLPESDSE